MVGLAAPEFSTLGPVILSRAGPASQLRDLTRRVSRTATLDGAAVLTDAGFADADRTLRIVAPGATRATLDAVAELLQTFATVLVSTDEGLFEAALSALSVSRGDLNVTALVKEKLSA